MSQLLACHWSFLQTSLKIKRQIVFFFKQPAKNQLGFLRMKLTKQKLRIKIMWEINSNFEFQYFIPRRLAVPDFRVDHFFSSAEIDLWFYFTHLLNSHIFMGLSLSSLFCSAHQLISLSVFKQFHRIFTIIALLYILISGRASPSFLRCT